MKTVYRNIFKEYNIPCDAPKRRRKRIKVKPKTSPRVDESCLIESFSEDENLSTSYKFIQLRRSFEIPLKIVTTSKNGVNRSADDISRVKPRERGLKAPTPSTHCDNVDLMPRPIIVKEEPSEDIQLSWHSSTISSITSTIGRRSLMKSKMQSTLGSNNRNTRLRKALALSNTSLNMTQTPKSSKKDSPTRYQSLDISITKKTPPRRSPRNASKNKTFNKSPSYRRNLNSCWLSSDEAPFQANSSSAGENSFICSSPKDSQIIETPSSTTSPRKVISRPSELDLMIELIEKENAEKNAKVKKSPKKSSKRCLPGGYVDMFQRFLAKAKTDGKFLKHDKKYGLITGQILKILKLESCHGVHVAKVQREGSRNRKAFWIVLPSDVATQITPNAKIEAFFEEATKPYSLKEEKGKPIDVFIKPYKLLLL